MKINREAREHAKKLMKVCMLTGQLDEPKMRTIIDRLASEKPRNWVPILERLRKLIHLETSKRTVTIESAAELPDKGASITADLEKQYGPALASHYSVRPELLAGIRVQRGSDVWDGSVLRNLQNLKNLLSEER